MFTLEYMKNRKTNIAPINQRAAYTTLFRAKSCAKLQLLDFNREHKVNVAVLNEMKRMRKYAVFIWQHPIAEGSGYNLRLWKAHIEQFITDAEIIKYCDIMCFTETYTS